MSVSNNFPTIKPSLSLDFANSGVLDPRITFTRASTGTYYDGVTTAKAEQNLLTYSQEFDNGIWAKNNATVTANTTAAPDGTPTADTITDNSTNASHYAYYSVSSIVSAGTTYAISCYLKAGTSNYGWLSLGDAATAQRYFSADFDLSGGTVRISGAGTSGTLTSATITPAGTAGWYRCVIIGQIANLGSMRLDIGVSDGTTSFSTFGSIPYVGSGSTIYAWGAQLEQRSAVSSYTATTTQPITNYIPVLQTAAANVARFDHNPTTGEALGLLIEEQRTNLLTYSSDYSNAAWTKTTSTVTSNAIIAPDGTLTGNKLIVDNTQTSGYLSESNSYTSGSAYTFSCYAKQGEQTDFRILTPTSAFGAPLSGVFNLATGTVTSFSASSASIQSVGNGWYRCSITATATVTTTGFLQLRSNYTGNGYSGIYVWGAQLEAGAFPTSYIPTPSNSQVTREADAASMTGANFSSWFNIGAGTLYAEGRSVNSITGTTARRYAEIDDGTINSAISVEFRNTTQSRFNVSNSALIDGGGIIDQFSKLAGAYAVNNFAFCANGTLGIPDTSGAIPAVTQLVIGNRADLNKAGTINGHLRKISYYPQRLSDANLQALTS